MNVAAVAVCVASAGFCVAAVLAPLHKPYDVDHWLAGLGRVGNPRLYDHAVYVDVVDVAVPIPYVCRSPTCFHAQTPPPSPRSATRLGWGIWPAPRKG